MDSILETVEHITRGYGEVGNGTNVRHASKTIGRWCLSIRQGMVCWIEGNCKINSGYWDVAIRDTQTDRLLQIGLYDSVNVVKESDIVVLEILCETNEDGTELAAKARGFLG
jgi:hypothetical protein